MLGEPEPDLGYDPEPVKEWAQGSIMDSLRRQRDDQAAGLTCFINIPGYKGMLKAEYRVLPAAEMRNIGKSIQRQFKDDTERQIMAIIDTLIRANEGIYYVEEDESLTPIDPDKSGVTCTYADPRLADALNIDHSSSRDILQGVFMHRDPAIIAHGMKLSRWYEDTSKEVDEDFLGE